MSTESGDIRRDTLVIRSRTPAVEWVLRADGGWDVVEIADLLTEMINVARERIVANRARIRQTRELINAVRTRMRHREEWRTLPRSAPVH